MNINYMNKVDLTFLFSFAQISVPHYPKKQSIVFRLCVYINRHTQTHPYLVIQ